MPDPVVDVEHMKSICKKEGGQASFFIVLAGGAARSSKDITFSTEDGWTIFNNIDDSWQDYRTDRNMLKFTNIGKALEKGAFYSY